MEKNINNNKLNIFDEFFSRQYSFKTKTKKKQNTQPNAENMHANDVNHTGNMKVIITNFDTNSTHLHNFKHIAHNQSHSQKHQNVPQTMATNTFNNPIFNNSDHSLPIFVMSDTNKSSNATLHGSNNAMELNTAHNNNIINDGLVVVQSLRSNYGTQVRLKKDESNTAAQNNLDIMSENTKNINDDDILPKNMNHVENNFNFNKTKGIKKTKFHFNCNLFLIFEKDVMF